MFVFSDVIYMSAETKVGFFVVAHHRLGTDLHRTCDNAGRVGTTIDEIAGQDQTVGALLELDGT